MKLRLLLLLSLMGCFAVQGVNAQDYYYQDYYYQDNYNNKHHHHYSNKKYKKKRRHHQHYYNNNYNNYYQNNSCQDYSYQEPYGAYTMDNQQFYEALTAIKQATFSETQLQMANMILSNAWLTTSQITQIIDIFSFEDTRLQFAKQAYYKCVDPQNYFRVFNSFYFSSSKDELSAFLTNQY